MCIRGEEEGQDKWAAVRLRVQRDGHALGKLGSTLVRNFQTVSLFLCEYRMHTVLVAYSTVLPDSGDGIVLQEVQAMLHDAYRQQLAHHQAVWSKPCLATRDAIIASCK